MTEQKKPSKSSTIVGKLYNRRVDEKPKPCNTNPPGPGKRLNDATPEEWDRAAKAARKKK